MEWRLRDIAKLGHDSLQTAIFKMSKMNKISLHKRCKTMSNDAPETNLLNETPCGNCGEPVFDRAPACPNCGHKIYVEHPGDITPTKHEQLPIHREEKQN